MGEKIFEVVAMDALDIFGVNDRNLEILRSHFPKLKIIARDNYLKVIGDDREIGAFGEQLAVIMLHYQKFGKVTQEEIRQLLSGDDTDYAATVNGSNGVLVHGPKGLQVRARTPNQLKMVESIAQNDIVFAIGPAGTGKTYTAVALAVRALRNREVQRIILTRPAVEAGENLGFLPGDLKDKLDPYLQPLYDALHDMIPSQKLLTYLEDGTIEIAPLAYMRGRTLNNVFAILDEAQNTTPRQLKMFLTRMGTIAKFIITGDITQVDLPRNQTSGLIHASQTLKEIPGVDFIWLDTGDIVRHKLVTRIIEAYQRGDDEQ